MKSQTQEKKHISPVKKTKREDRMISSNRKQGLKILLIVFAFANFTSAQTFYKTSFEIAEEPFGVFREDFLNTQSEWTGNGKIMHEISHNGSQCASPGYGDGEYGKNMAMDFEPREVGELWIDYFVYPAKSVETYGAFLILNGLNKNSEPTISVYIIFERDGTIYGMVPSGDKLGISPWTSGNWQRITLKLDFKKKSYDIFLNEKLKKAGVAFYGHKQTEFGKPENLIKINLGGGGAKDSLTYYDDVYVGTANPLTKE